MKEDSKKLLKNYLYEIKVKRIQNIFDTFYFSSDFKEMIELGEDATRECWDDIMALNE